MPNPYLDHSQRWLDLSDIDYFGQFVKAWLAFNAWYRSAYTLQQDRQVMDAFKWDNNIVRSKIVRLLRAEDEDGEFFRNLVGRLHHRLENFEIRNRNEAISFTRVFLKANALANAGDTEYGVTYQVARGGTGNPSEQVRCSVTNSRAVTLFGLTQNRYDEAELRAASQFQTGLRPAPQAKLMSYYIQVNPRLMRNLLISGSQSLRMGSYQFSNNFDELFAGIVELLYMLRCHLFHGELVPNREANACYEPAYHILRRFILCIS